MFDLRLCNAVTIRYSQLKFGHVHLCGMYQTYFSPHCCKCNSFGCTAAIRCGNACHGPHSDSLYAGNEHSQFSSLRLVKREAGFPNPRQALIGSNQLWRINDSPYYRELWSIRECYQDSLWCYTKLVNRNPKTIQQGKSLFSLHGWCMLDHCTYLLYDLSQGVSTRAVIHDFQPAMISYFPELFHWLREWCHTQGYLLIITDVEPPVQEGLGCLITGSISDNTSFIHIWIHILYSIVQFWSCVIGYLNCYAGISLWSLNIKIFTNIPWCHFQTGRYYPTILLTHWGWVTHICISKLTIIGSDNGWTNAGILLIGPFGTNFSEILIETHAFSFKKMHLKMSSEKWQPFCLGLNVLTHWGLALCMWSGSSLTQVMSCCLLSTKSHHLNRCCLIVYWTLTDKLHCKM